MDKIITEEIKKKAEELRKEEAYNLGFQEGKNMKGSSWREGYERGLEEGYSKCWEQFKDMDAYQLGLQKGREEREIAFENWLGTEQGQKCVKGSASGVYLKNRLYFAFMAGIESKNGKGD